MNEAIIMHGKDANGNTIVIEVDSTGVLQVG